jgi:hypothetical protein
VGKRPLGWGPRARGEHPEVSSAPGHGKQRRLLVEYRQLREWAGIDPELLAILGDIEINGQVVKRREATVWLYPNIPGRQDVASDRPPFRLRRSQGIAVYAQGDVPPGPRLPLLGLPAFLNNDLDLWLDPERRHITVQPQLAQASHPSSLPIVI